MHRPGPRGSVPKPAKGKAPRSTFSRPHRPASAASATPSGVSSNIPTGGSSPTARCGPSPSPGGTTPLRPPTSSAIPLSGPPFPMAPHAWFRSPPETAASATPPWKKTDRHPSTHTPANRHLVAVLDHLCCRARSIHRTLGQDVGPYPDLCRRIQTRLGRMLRSTRSRASPRLRHPIPSPPTSTSAIPPPSPFVGN